MNNVKKQAFTAFDLLTEREQTLVFELIKSLAPDDIATMNDYQRGEAIPINEINWN